MGFLRVGQAVSWVAGYLPFPKLLLLGGAHISQEKWLLLYRGREDAPAVILADAPLRLSPIPSTPVSLQATPVHTSLPLPLKPRVSGWEQNPSAQALKTNVPVSGRLRFSPADSSPAAGCCVRSCSCLWLCGLGSQPGSKPLSSQGCPAGTYPSSPSSPSPAAPGSWASPSHDPPFLQVST